MNQQDAIRVVEQIRSRITQVIRGKAEVIDLLLIGILSGGHVLLEDVPGVGKTTLAKALAKAFRVDFTRVQFTPDLLPSDILGSQILHPKEGTFSFHQGPLFTNVLLADEVNRASPRTQSALLEAMNESQATIDGTTYPLPRPFFVLATQNPADHQGTYPLPEAQLDRFLLRLSIGYPAMDDELQMLFSHQRSNPVDLVEPITDGATLLQIQEQIRAVEVQKSVARYLLTLVEQTRKHEDLEIGVSPRGAIAYFRAVQAKAFLDNRSYVTPSDIQALALPILAHRIRLASQARYAGTTAESAISSILSSVPVPT